MTAIIGRVYCNGAQFTHDCTADTFIATIPGICDIYQQCDGYGYIVRYGNDGPDYGSSSRWNLADALHYAAHYAARKLNVKLNN